MKKIDFRTVSEFERLALRKRAIRLIVSGTRKGVVADLIGVRPNTVSEWWKDYQLAGSKGLVSKKKGAKPEDKKLLSNEQEFQIQQMIVDKALKQVGST